MVKVDLACSLLWMMVACNTLLVVLEATEAQDVKALQSLMDNWENTPPSWRQSNDPCGSSPWDGVVCNNSRVVTLHLSSMTLKGTLHPEIGLLTELQTLDLSYNKDLGGQLTPNIGNLKKLTVLILAGCSFSGNIPSELGSLQTLTYLSLNKNKFTGPIPASLGGLSQLSWFDIAENQLSGPLPISSGTDPGLDKLFSVEHFYFSKNQLSGSIPPEFFNSEMKALNVIFDGNLFTGSIPETVRVAKRIEVLRLDRNRLTGPIPPNITILSTIGVLHLDNNQLTGSIPDLTGLDNLNYLDLSNNSFDESEAPSWFTALPAITTLVLESSNLTGTVPEELFASSQLEKVFLKKNSFSGLLSFPNNVSQRLRLVDLQNNQIATFSIISSIPKGVAILLNGNNACFMNPTYCGLGQQTGPAYLTDVAKCNSTTCPAGQSTAPLSCECAHPYQGLMVCKAPRFSDLTNSTRFQGFEAAISASIGVNNVSVTLQDLFFNSDNYLQMLLSVFPSDGTYFNRTYIQTLGFYFSKQLFTTPGGFGPCFFDAVPYAFSDTSSTQSSIKTSVVVLIAAGCSILAIGLVVISVYAIRQKKRAENAKRFGQGTRIFDLKAIKKCTDNFSESNTIGVGGYGKVYKGMLEGKVVAIKKAHKVNEQGARASEIEIKLLSRLHHRNLVKLIGICHDHDEQMLVYEYIPNGTLKEHLTGEKEPRLSWSRRLQIALGSASALDYIHKFADPPIIHRDVKSMNILLDESLTAKVADFGISKSMADGETAHIIPHGEEFGISKTKADGEISNNATRVIGTPGYLDPEYMMSQNLTDKSDVYSFGMMMMELIISRLPMVEGKNMMTEIKAAVDWEDEQYCGLKDIIDPFLLQKQLPGFPKFLNLALRCINESGSKRPSMNQVVKDIEAVVAEVPTATSAGVNSSASEKESHGLLY